MEGESAAETRDAETQTTTKSGAADEANLDSEDLFEVMEREALELCGLSRERAFAIDDKSLGTKHEDLVFFNLCTAFFAKVYDSPDQSLRNCFSNSKEEHIQNLAEYLYQRCGGSTAYSARQGLPAVQCKHWRMGITEELAEAWLDHMEEALDEARREIGLEDRLALFDFMRFSAYLFVVGGRYNQMIVRKGIFF